MEELMEKNREDLGPRLRTGLCDTESERHSILLSPKADSQTAKLDDVTTQLVHFKYKKCSFFRRLLKLLYNICSKLCV